jgi:hypothetical protein
MNVRNSDFLDLRGTGKNEVPLINMICEIWIVNLY